MERVAQDSLSNKNKSNPRAYLLSRIVLLFDKFMLILSIYLQVIAEIIWAFPSIILHHTWVLFVAIEIVCRVIERVDK